MPNEPCRPSCLHVPPLYGGRVAPLCWQAAANAAGYELECSPGEDFEAAARGLSWQNLDAQQKRWSEINDTLAWGVFEARPAYGRSWYSLDWSGTDWDGRDGEELSWDAFAGLPVGFVLYRGPGEEAAGPDDGLPPDAGLSWNGADGRCLGWDAAEALVASWDAFEQITPDGGPHRGWQVELADEDMRAYFRVRSYGAAGGYSSYLETPVQYVFAEEETAVTVENGAYIYLQIDAEGARSFAGSVFSVLYDPQALVFDSITAEYRGKETPPCAQPFVVYYASGLLRLACGLDIDPSARWDGLIIRAGFLAGRAGETLVRLERVSTGDRQPL